MKTDRTGEDITLAPVVEALHTVYREHLAPVAHEATGATLPPALMVVKRDQRAWGHITTRPAWETEQETLDTDYPYGGWAVSMGAPMTTVTRAGFHEIMVSGENLARGARAVFGTLAHEATHALNIVRGIRDVDSNGRHNRRFADPAERVFGLTISQAPSIGWSVTDVSDACATRWADAIALIDEAIKATAPRHETGGFGVFGGGSRPKTGTGSRGGTGRNKNNPKAVCACGHSIRAGRATLDLCRPTCGLCGEPFVAVE